MNVGDTIIFNYKGEKLEGSVVKLGSMATIKLASGYNLLVPKEDLKAAKTSAGKIKKQVVPQPKMNEKLPKIKILHTGGTIASKVDYATGAVVSKFSEKDIVAMFPELLSIANISSFMIGNLSSEMLRFAHWNLFAKEVEKAVKEGAQGVIITLGTDALATIAASGAFALENIHIPVLFVGAQRSSDRPSSDAASNLLCAAKFIVESHKDFKGVGICMHESNKNDNCVILSATRTRKMHTSRRDAFKPINDVPLARITYPDLQVKQLANYPQSAGVFKVKPFKETLQVGILYIHQQMFPEEFELYTSWDGLVLAGTGLGHLPSEQTDKHNVMNEKIAKSLKELAKKIPVVMAPQTIFGRVNMNVYSPGRALITMGVLGQDCDMTIDTAFVKLAWLLSNHKKDVRKLYAQNLRGELSERSGEQGYLE